MRQAAEFAQISLPGARVALVAAPYYKDIVEDLLRGARAALASAGAQETVFQVPGALELPLAIAMLEEQRSAHFSPFDGYVALGCVIRGETSHYDTVCNQSAAGLMQLGLRGRFGIANAILTVETMEQARERADPAGQNKGGEAARACLALIALRTVLAVP